MNIKNSWIVGWVKNICLLLFLCILFIAVSDCDVCSNDCSTTSQHINTNQNNNIKCRMQNTSCFNITRSDNSDINKPVIKNQFWYLYDEGKKIALNISWGPNQESTISELKGYKILFKGEKGDFKKYYCLQNNLNFHDHSFAEFYYDCYGKLGTTEISPGETIRGFIFNIPGTKKSSFKIKIPSCEDKRLAKVLSCAPEKQLFIVMNKNSINCKNGEVNFSYNVPISVKYDFASILLLQNDNEISFNSNLPLSFNNHTIKLNGYYLHHNYTIQVWGGGSGPIRAQTKFNFGSCIKTPETNLVLPIVVPLGVLLFVGVIGFIIYNYHAQIWSTMRNCPGITLKPHLRERSVQVSIPASVDPNNCNGNSTLNTPWEEVINAEPLYHVTSASEPNIPVKVFIVFVADNSYHTNVVRKFAEYLDSDLNFDVKIELWEKLEIMVDYATWLENSYKESQKIIVIWSPGAKKRWQEKGNNSYISQDLFTPVIIDIKRDLYIKNNRKKYFFAYFDYCSAKDDIPSDFHDYSTRTFNLMKGFEPLYFYLKDMEMFQKGEDKIQKKVKFNYYGNPQINRFGPYLQQTILEAVKFAQENEDWFSDYKEKNLAEQLDVPEIDDAHYLQEIRMKIKPPSPILRIQTQPEDTSSSYCVSNLQSSNLGSSFMCSSFCKKNDLSSTETNESSITTVKGLLLNQQLHSLTEEESDPSENVSQIDEIEENDEEQSYSLLQPELFTSRDFQSGDNSQSDFESESYFPILRPPVDFESNPSEVLQNINNSFV